MKIKAIHSLLAGIALAASLQPSLAQTSQQDCQDALNAANAGKTAANVLISNAEQDLKTKVNAARACIEAFGAAGARLTILAGGYDLSGIQSMMSQAACSVIQNRLSSAVASIPNIAIPVYNPGAAVSVPAVVAPKPASFWANLTNTILGAN